jgi:hypothetical protein
MSTSLSWSIGIAVVPATSALPWYVATRSRPCRSDRLGRAAISEAVSPGGTELSVRRSSVAPRSSVQGHGGLDVAVRVDRSNRPLAEDRCDRTLDSDRGGTGDGRRRGETRQHSHRATPARRGALAERSGPRPIQRG